MRNARRKLVQIQRLRNQEKSGQRAPRFDACYRGDLCPVVQRGCLLRPNHLSGKYHYLFLCVCGIAAIKGQLHRHAEMRSRRGGRVHPLRQKINQSLWNFLEADHRRMGELAQCRPRLCQFFLADAYAALTAKHGTKVRCQSQEDFPLLQFG